MVLNVAWLKMDNWALNRFPSCNEEEVIGKGKCLSLQCCLQRELASSYTQHCHAGTIRGAVEPGISPQDLRTHLVTSGT